MGVLFTRLAIISTIAMLLWLFLRLVYVRATKTKPELLREIILCLFIAFMAGLIGLVLWPGNTHYSEGYVLGNILARIQNGQDINLIPFATIVSVARAGFNTRFVVNIIANVLMFLPLGLGLPLLWQRWQGKGKVFLAGTGFSITIEIVQLFIGRSTDIDDVILNVAGVMLGYVVYLVLVRVLPGACALAAKKQRQALPSNRA